MQICQMLRRATISLLFSCLSHGDFTVYMTAAGCTLFLSFFTANDKANFFLVKINLFSSLFQLSVF